MSVLKEPSPRAHELTTAADEAAASGGAEPMVVARLGPSATLGEMALLYNTTRTATVTAREPSSVYSLSRAAYQITLIEGTDTLADDGTEKDDPQDSSTRLRALRAFPWLLEQVIACWLHADCMLIACWALRAFP